MAAPIMGDATVTARGQKEHLVLEGIGAERPAVTEDDRLPVAPILVVDLRAVFGDYRRHVTLPPEQVCRVALHYTLHVSLRPITVMSSRRGTTQSVSATWLRATTLRGRASP